ncbi:MAG: ATP-NAD kinase [Rhodothermales bacterium]|nr:ATP-NAD kinase [Rhodothermales bacterium]
MIYGITGNTKKDRLWAPVLNLLKWLGESNIPYLLNPSVAKGLSVRHPDANPLIDGKVSDDLENAADIILSFGGDGTFLNTAFEVGTSGTPILGINIGRLGFLADVDVQIVERAIREMEAGRHHIETRMALEVQVNGDRDNLMWALNELVITRSGAASLISIDVSVDGNHLNTYWADGLVIATPTGSTAYSLSAGGPILSPGARSIILTPLAPHALTVRPIVLPDTSIITARVLEDSLPFVYAPDGKSVLVDDVETSFRISKADHTVNLVKLANSDFFETLRSKLMWGYRKSSSD